MFLFESYSTMQIKEYGEEVDVILLTPVCKASKVEIEQLFPNKPIIIITTIDYGLSNVYTVYEELHAYNNK